MVIQRQLLDAAASRPRDRGFFSSGCAGVGSNKPSSRYPLVVEYSREEQARVAAEELALLPEGSAIEEMLADYAMMREQVRVCGGL